MSDMNFDLDVILRQDALDKAINYGCSQQDAITVADKFYQFMRTGVSSPNVQSTTENKPVKKVALPHARWV